MRLTLPSETQELVGVFEHWARDRSGFEMTPVDDAKAWRTLVDLGFFEIEQCGGTALDVVCALMAGARKPLPGPVVEADLAVRVAPEVALEELHKGNIVTSVVARGDRPTPVAGGAVASLVIDRTDGHVMARGPLPTVKNAFGLRLGWHTGEESRGSDPTVARRWLLSSAVVTGLASGALEMTLEHAKNRVLFGRPLASFQAAQMRLAECKVLLEGSILATRDAGCRATSPLGEVSAALAWIYASTATDTIMKQCHQLFGALGFCDETGLTRFSTEVRWLRLASPLAEPSQVVMRQRRRAPGVPPSLVLQGFAGHG